MGVSFKISSSGSRFKPKPALVSEVVADTLAETSKIASKNESNNSTTNTVASCRKFDGIDEDSVRFSDSSLSFRGNQCFSDHEVSFTLNLFHDGYSIGKPSEDIGHHASVHDAPKLVLPYGRASEPLFLAIESGWLPGDILDDIPCKYVDGGLICQVRDFRKCTSNSGSTTDVSPITTKVHLRMSLENVVKDICSFADDSWTYGDLMEVESRVLKALQPKLGLDPTPRILSEDPVSSKVNLGLSGLRRKRMTEMADVVAIASPGAQDMTICYNDSMNNTLPHGSGKRARIAAQAESNPSPSRKDQHQQQQQAAAKWRSNSLPNTNLCIPINAPSAILPHHSMLHKFSKILMLPARFKLNSKRTKTDDLSRKHLTFSPQEVGIALSTIANDENIKDDSSAMPMSKSLVGGSINTLKIRIMSFKLPDRTLPGNIPVAARARARLIMSEKPLDGTVAMHFGEMEVTDYLNAEDYLPTLSTPHFADLLASQLSVLMVGEGYYLDDYVEAREAAAAAINSQQQQQMMHEGQFSRAVLLPPAAACLPNALGSQMVNRASSQSEMQSERKMGSGPNNIVMGMGMVGPTGGMASDFTNAISQQLRSGALTHMQAHSILANCGMTGGGPHSGMTRQMQQPSGLSMLTHTLQQQQQQQHRPSLAAPRLMNVHLNQQQHQQQVSSPLGPIHHHPTTAAKPHPRPPYPSA